MVVDPYGMLAHVHKDLARVILATPQSPMPFAVIYGIRTLAAEAELVREHKSETMHSRHLPDPRFPGPQDPGGLAMAVDFLTYPNGVDSWVVGQGGGNYATVGHLAIATSIQLLGLGPKGFPKVMWGGAAISAWTDGDHSGFHDWDHLQLDPAAYP
jgi:hypothetical protein